MQRLAPPLPVFGPGFLLVAVVAAYSSVFAHGYYMDDFNYLLAARDTSYQQWFGEAIGGGDWLYWRPLVHLLFKVSYDLFGLVPAGYLLVALGMHLLTGVLLYWAGTRLTGRSLGGVAAASLHLFAADHQQAVLWVSGAYNTLPAVLLLGFAGLCYARGVESTDRRLRVIGCVLAMTSLGVREAAYYFPLLVMGAHMTLGSGDWRRRLSQASAPTLLVLGAVITHFLLANRISLEHRTITDLFGNSFGLTAGFLQGMFTLPFSMAWIGGAALAVVGVVMWRGSPRQRFLALWSVFAFLPYVAYSTGSRHGYMAHIPIALLLASFLASGGARQTAWLSLLLGVAFSSATLRLPGVIAQERAFSDKCAAVRQWAAELPLEQYETLVVSELPYHLQNGLAAMLDLFNGQKLKVVDLMLAEAPPYAIVVNADGMVIPPEHATTGFLHYDRTGEEFSLSSRAEITQGRIPVPAVYFASKSLSEEEMGDALEAIKNGSVDPRTTVVLPAGDDSPVLQTLVPGDAMISRIDASAYPLITVDVSASVDAYLMVCLPPNYLQESQVLVDGQPADMRAANGVFRAALVRAGSQKVEIRLAEAQQQQQ